MPRQNSHPETHSIRHSVAVSVGGAGSWDRRVLVLVIQRDSILCLPDLCGWCFFGDLSAAIAGAGLATVSVLIRSLSTLSRV